jgi:hypothetical protein
MIKSSRPDQKQLKFNRLQRAKSYIFVDFGLRCVLCTLEAKNVALTSTRSVYRFSIDSFYASSHSLDVSDGGIRLVFHSSSWPSVGGKHHPSVVFFSGSSWSLPKTLTSRLLNSLKPISPFFHTEPSWEDPETWISVWVQS